MHRHPQQQHGGHHGGHECPKWVPSHGGQVPRGAIDGGKSGANHEVMYVARAHHSGDLIPGKLVPSHRVCYVGCNNCEKGEHNYEVMVNCGHCHYYWEHASNGQVPHNAIVGGRVHNGEPLYIARGHPPPEPHGLHIGKLHASHGCAYISYNGTEHALHHYEVLCKNTCPKWVSAHNGQVPYGAIDGGKSGANHEIMYVARANHSGDLIPGKLVPSHKCAYVGCNNCEAGVKSYEVLVNCGHCHYYWERSVNGQVPPNAVEGGRCHTGETLYIARGHPPPEPHGLHIGKLHSSHRCAYISYNGTEHKLIQCEVLCKRPL